MFLESPAATPQISLLLFPLGRVGVGWLGQHSVPACWGFEATQLLGVWAVPPGLSQSCLSGGLCRPGQELGGLGLRPSSASALLSLGLYILEARRSDRNQVCTAVQTGRGAWGQEGLAPHQPHSPGGAQGPSACYTVPAAASGCRGGPVPIPWLLLRHSADGLRSCWGNGVLGQLGQEERSAAPRPTSYGVHQARPIPQPESVLSPESPTSCPLSF